MYHAGAWGKRDYPAESFQLEKYEMSEKQTLPAVPEYLKAYMAQPNTEADSLRRVASRFLASPCVVASFASSKVAKRFASRPMNCMRSSSRWNRKLACLSRPTTRVNTTAVTRRLRLAQAQMVLCPILGSRRHNRIVVLPAPRTSSAAPLLVAVRRPRRVATANVSGWLCLKTSKVRCMR